MKKLLTNCVTIFTAISCSGIAYCKNGGFYGCANFGIQVMMTKTCTNSKTLWKDEKYAEDVEEITISNRIGATIEHDNAKMFSILVANTHKVRKNQISPFIELAFGYEWTLNNIILGPEVLFGQTCKNVSLKSKQHDVGGYNNDVITYYQPREFGKVKTKFYFGQMFKVGYCFCEKFNGYLAIGLKLQKRKYETYTHANSQLNGTNEADKPLTKSNAYNIKTNKSSTRIIPVVGAGIQYRFTDRIFARLEYNYEFKTRVKLPSNGIAEVTEVNISSSTVKLGIGAHIG